MPELAGRFLEEFLLIPTINDLEKNFKGFRTQRAIKYGDPDEVIPYFETDKLTQHFSGLFDGLIIANGQVPDSVHDAFMRLAQHYAEAYGHQPLYRDDPNQTINAARIRALVINPYFIASPQNAVPFMENLSDITYGTPWHSETYTPYIHGVRGQDGHRGPIQGFGPKQIDGFRNLIGSESLWSGKNTLSDGGRNSFLFAVTKGLTLMAETHPNETFEPRVEVLRRTQSLIDQKAQLSAEITQGILIDLMRSFNTQEQRDRIKSLPEYPQSTYFSVRLHRIASGDRLSGAAF